MKKRDRKQVEVRNPRYEGATPEDVARGLLRQIKGEKQKEEKEEDET